jgi:hypothetical protein
MNLPSQRSREEDSNAFLLAVGLRYARAHCLL